MSSWMLRLFARKEGVAEPADHRHGADHEIEAHVGDHAHDGRPRHAHPTRLINDVAGEPLGDERADAGDHVQHRIRADLDGRARNADRRVEQARERDEPAAGRLDRGGCEDFDVGARAQCVTGGGVGHRILPKEMRHRRHIWCERVRHHRPVWTIRGARTPLPPIDLEAHCRISRVYSHSTEHLNQL